MIQPSPVGGVCGVDRVHQLLKFGSSPVEPFGADVVPPDRLDRVDVDLELLELVLDLGLVGIELVVRSGSGKYCADHLRNCGHMPRSDGSLTSALPSANLPSHSPLAVSNAVLMPLPRLVTRLGLLDGRPGTGAW